MTQIRASAIKAPDPGLSNETTRPQLPGTIPLGPHSGDNKTLDPVTTTAEQTILDAGAAAELVTLIAGGHILRVIPSDSCHFPAVSVALGALACDRARRCTGKLAYSGVGSSPHGCVAWLAGDAQVSVAEDLNMRLDDEHASVSEEVVIGLSCPAAWHCQAVGRRLGRAGITHPAVGVPR